jgi:hypothetical protein
MRRTLSTSWEDAFDECIAYHVQSAVTQCNYVFQCHMSSRKECDKKRIDCNGGGSIHTTMYDWFILKDPCETSIAVL